MKESFWSYVLLILMWVFIIALIAFVGINIFWLIYAFVKYGGKPISEIPSWALFYMFRG